MTIIDKLERADGPERVVLYNADCMDVLPGLDPVDAIIADLPYGTTQNAWDCALPLPALWTHYRRLSSISVLSAQGGFTAELICSNRRDFKYKIVWEKSKATNFLNAKKQPLRKHEDICVFGRGPYNPQMQPGAPYDKGVRKDQQTGSYGDFKPAHIRSAGERYPTDVIYFATAESEGAVVHPTQKPLALMRYLVRTFSDPGGVILDNAMGSGTTGVAAILEGRKFVGIERDPATFAVAEDRIAAALRARSQGGE